MQKNKTILLTLLFFGLAITLPAYTSEPQSEYLTTHDHLFKADRWYSGWGITRWLPLFWIFHNKITCPNCRERAKLMLESAKKGNVELCDKCITTKDVRINEQDELGNSVLHYAIQYGHKELAKLLILKNRNTNWLDAIAAYIIGKRANLDLKNYNGDTPAHIGATHKEDALLILLHEYNARLSEKNKVGLTPLLSAAALGNNRTLQTLSQLDPSTKYIKTSDGETVLHVATRKKNIQLINYFAQDQQLLEEVDNNGNTALICAALTNENNIVTTLLENGAHSSTKSGNGETILHIAVKNENNELADLALKHGIEIDTSNENGNTALETAIEQNNSQIVGFLLSRGAKANIIDVKGNNLLHKAVVTKCVDVIPSLIAHINPNLANYDGLTPLMLAAQHGNKELTDLFLQNNVNVNAVTNTGETALALAASAGHTEIVLMLSEHSSDTINRPNNFGATPVMLAIQKGHTTTAYQLIEAEADLSHVDRLKNNALHYAVINNNKELTSYLSNHFPALLQHKNINGNSPLHITILYKHHDITQQLISTKASLNVQNNDGHTPFHLAAISGDTQLVKKMISLGAETEMQDNDGNTALHLAIIHNHEESAIYLAQQSGIAIQNKAKQSPLHLAIACRAQNVTQQLLQSKADPNNVDIYGETPLHIAVAEGNYDAARLLLQYQANIDRTNNNNDTPLHIAAEMNNIELTEFLLQHGAKLAIPNNNGYLPLHIAAKNGAEKVTEKLLLYHSPINAYDNNGYTPLIIAIVHNNPAVAQLLIANDALIDAVDDNGDTALLHAAKTGNIQNIKMLIKARANIAVQNKSGNTALDIAAYHGKKDAVELFLHEGLDSSLEQALYNAKLKNHHSMERLIEEHKKEKEDTLQIIKQAHKNVANLAHENKKLHQELLQKARQGKIHYPERDQYCPSPCSTQLNIAILNNMNNSERKRRLHALLQCQQMETQEATRLQQKLETKEITEQKNNEQQLEECNICFENKASVKRVSCAHCEKGSARICSECVAQIDKCPFCRGPLK